MHQSITAALTGYHWCENIVHVESGRECCFSLWLALHVLRIVLSFGVEPIAMPRQTANWILRIGPAVLRGVFSQKKRYRRVVLDLGLVSTLGFGGFDTIFGFGNSLQLPASCIPKRPRIRFLFNLGLSRKTPQFRSPPNLRYSLPIVMALSPTRCQASAARGVITCVLNILRTKTAAQLAIDPDHLARLQEERDAEETPSEEDRDSEQL